MSYPTTRAFRLMNKEGEVLGRGQCGSLVRGQDVWTHDLTWEKVNSKRIFKAYASRENLEIHTSIWICDTSIAAIEIAAGEVSNLEVNIFDVRIRPTKWKT